MHAGHEYVKGRTTNGITYWRCVKNRHEQCKGKASTMQIDSVQMVKAYDTHNHLPENIPIETTFYTLN